MFFKYFKEQKKTRRGTTAAILMAVAVTAIYGIVPVPAQDVQETEKTVERKYDARELREFMNGTSFTIETESEGAPAEDVLEIKSDVTYKGGDYKGKIENVIKTEDTSVLSPARPGSFVEFPLCSSDDRKYHNVLLSVDGVWTQSRDGEFIDRIMEANNAYGGYCTIDKNAKMPDDVEFCVMKYTFMIPKDFPSKYYGIYELDPHFRIRTINNTAVPSKDGSTSYEGLTRADHLMTEDRDGPYLPGGIYEQYALFEMVKGYRDYVFTVSAYKAGTNIEYPGKAEYVTAYFSPFTEEETSAGQEAVPDGLNEEGAQDK